MAKIQVGVDAGSYAFNTAGKTVTFSGLTGLDLSAILAVINAKTGDVLYQVGDATKVATFAANVLTLNAGVSMTGMANGDPLTIFADVSPAQTGTTASIVPDLTLTGTLTTGQISSALSVAGRAGFGLSITGTWTGSLIVEEQVGDGVWQNVSTAPLAGGPRTSTVVANGIYEGLSAGVQQIRVNGTSVASGTVNFALVVADKSRITRIWSTDAANVLATVNLRDGAGNAITSTGGALNVMASSLSTILADFGISSVGVPIGYNNVGAYATAGIEFNTVPTGCSAVVEGMVKNTWATLPLVPFSGANPVSLVTAPGSFQFELGGLSQIRIRAVTLPTGAILGCIGVGSGASVVSVDSLPGYDPVFGKLMVGTSRDKWRFVFNTIDTSNWTYNMDANGRHWIDGNVAGATYDAVSLNATVAGLYSEVVSVNTFSLPNKIAAGLSISQRVIGEELSMDWVAVDNFNTIIPESTYGASTTPMLISQIVIASNVATITTNSAHGLVPGQTLFLYGCGDSRFNVGPVLVTSLVQPTPTTVFTCPLTYANGTYTSGQAVVGSAAYVQAFDPMGGALHGIGMRFIGNSASNADAVSRAGTPTCQTVNWNPGNSESNSSTPNENGINYTTTPQYTRPFRPTGEWNLTHRMDLIRWRLSDQDSVAAPRSISKRGQNVPDIMRQYKLRFRARQFPNKTIPVGRIVAISRPGSTTWTVVVPNHGLTINDYIVMYGVKDQTNFANLTVATVVASVVDANTFTVVSGTGTNASVGGLVYRVQGGNTPTLGTIACGTYNKTTDGLRMALVSSTGSWGETVGNTVQLYGATILVAGTLTSGQPTITGIPNTVGLLPGMLIQGLTTASALCFPINTTILTVDSSSQITATANALQNGAQSVGAVNTGIEGRWRVAYQSTTNMELEPLDGQSLAGMSTTAVPIGGTLLRPTDFRLHYLRVLDQIRFDVNIEGGDGHSDIAQSTPVVVNNTVTVSATNLSCNTAQFGGTNVSTGTGAGGTGIPRVTVSNDSQLKIWDGVTNVSVIAGTTALKTDISSVAGTAAVTGLGFATAANNGTQRVMPAQEAVLPLYQSAYQAINASFIRS